MSFKASSWTNEAGAISWVPMPDGFLIIPVFSSEDSFKIFDEKIKIMNTSKMIVTVVEHKMDYSLILYEDSEEKVTSKFEFLMSEMNFQGYYNKFKEDYDPLKKMYFSYAKHTHEPIPEASTEMEIELLIESFQIKKFRIIKESDLRLDEFIQQSTTQGFTPNGFEYNKEAAAILSGTDRDRENLV